jgi:hypothetical protein
MANWDAGNRMAALVMAEMLLIDPSEEEIRAEAERFCFLSGIRDPKAMESWLRDNDLSPHEFEVLMAENASIKKVHKSIRASMVMRRNTKILLDHLRITGEYSSYADEAAAHEMIVKRLAPDFMSQPMTREPVEAALSRHIDDCKAPWVHDLPSWLREVGFFSREELALDLDRSRIARGKRNETSETKGDAVSS